VTKEPIKSDLAMMATRLLALPKGQGKALELARALYNQGRREAAAEIEQLVLERGTAEAKHRWRLAQSARAPANQYLLINSPQRTSAFRAALDAMIRPDSRVLEIGTGSGILSMLAARAGARHIYTCEHQILMAAVAREIIKDNELTKTITVIAKSSDELELGIDIPHQVDVILCDVFTGSLLEAGGLGVVARAAKTFLKPGGSVIPGLGAISGSLVGGADLEALCRCVNVDGMRLQKFNLFSPTKLQLQPDQFQRLDIQSYSAPLDCFRFVIGQPDSDRPQRRRSEVEITRSGTITGLLQWTDLELAPGIRLHGLPGEAISWPRFLHVFPEPIQVRSGQSLSLMQEHNALQFSVWPLSDQ